MRACVNRDRQTEIETETNTTLQQLWHYMETALILHSPEYLPAVRAESLEEKQNKTKQSKTKQNKIKQNKTKQNKSKNKSKTKQTKKQTKTVLRSTSGDRDGMHSIPSVETNHSMLYLTTTTRSMLHTTSAHINGC